MIGRKLTNEHKEKIGNASRGRILTDDHKQAISDAKSGRPNGLSGRVMPESHRKAISKATMGRRTLTKEEQARRLDTWKKRCGGKIKTSKAKVVICVETQKRYRCASEAAEDVSGSDKHIQACCVGRRKKHKGFSWNYIEQRILCFPKK